MNNISSNMNLGIRNFNTNNQEIKNSKTDHYSESDFPVGLDEFKAGNITETELYSMNFDPKSSQTKPQGLCRENLPEIAGNIVSGAFNLFGKVFSGMVAGTAGALTGTAGVLAASALGAGTAGCVATALVAGAGVAVGLYNAMTA